MENDNCERCKNKTRARLCNELGHYRVFADNIERIWNTATDDNWEKKIWEALL